MPSRKERLKGAEISEDLVVFLEGGEDHEEQGEDGDARGDDEAEIGQDPGSPPGGGTTTAARPRRHEVFLEAPRAAMAAVTGAAPALVVSVSMSVLLPGEPTLDEADDQDGDEEYE